MLANLRDEKFFPSFLNLPNGYELDESFYRSRDGLSYTPRRHWCLLAEIEEVETFVRVRLIVRDVRGHRLPLAFYLDNDDKSALDDIRFKVGSTVAVLYATQHPFLDQSVGVRQEELTTFKILPFSLDAILQLSDKMHEKSKTGGGESCHMCNEPSDSLKKCNACKLTLYCSKECQAKDWNDVQNSHKVTCKQLRHLVPFFLFNWKSFDDIVKFPITVT